MPLLDDSFYRALKPVALRMDRRPGWSHYEALTDAVLRVIDHQVGVSFLCGGVPRHLTPAQVMEQVREGGATGAIEHFAKAWDIPKTTPANQS